MPISIDTDKEHLARAIELARAGVAGCQDRSRRIVGRGGVDASAAMLRRRSPAERALFAVVVGLDWRYQAFETAQQIFLGHPIELDIAGSIGRRAFQIRDQCRDRLSLGLVELEHNPRNNRVRAR